MIFGTKQLFVPIENVRFAIEKTQAHHPNPYEIKYINYDVLVAFLNILNMLPTNPPNELRMVLFSLRERFFSSLSTPLW